MSVLDKISYMASTASFANQIAYKLGVVSSIMYNIANRATQTESQALSKQYMETVDSILIYATSNDFETAQMIFDSSDKLEKYFI